jgi:hypothetical protein
VHLPGKLIQTENIAKFFQSVGASAVSLRRSPAVAEDADSPACEVSALSRHPIVSFPAFLIGTGHSALGPLPVRRTSRNGATRRVHLRSPSLKHAHFGLCLVVECRKNEENC